MPALASNIGSYIKSLLPEFKKQNIQIDVAHCFEELNQAISPMYTLSPVPKLTGNTVEHAEFQFPKLIKSYKTSPYVTIAKTLDTILDNEDGIHALIKAEFTEETLKVVMDYHKVNIVKYIEALTFFSDFSRMWLSVTVWESLLAVTNATAPVSKNDDDVQYALPTSPYSSPVLMSSPTLKRDSEFVNNADNIASFAAACNMLALPLHKFLDTIKDLKGHTVQDEDFNYGHTLNNAKFDPFNTNFIPVTWNLVYHIGLAINGWRMARHERNKAELARLQLMLLALDQEKASASNPERIANLEKQINYYSNLSNKISIKIENMEDVGEAA